MKAWSREPEQALSMLAQAEELTGTTLLGYVKNRENDKNLKKIKKRFSDAESAIPILKDEGDGDSGAS